MYYIFSFVVFNKLIIKIDKWNKLVAESILLILVLTKFTYKTNFIYFKHITLEKITYRTIV